MKGERVLMFLFSLFLAAATIIGIALVFKGPAKERREPKEAVSWGNGRKGLGLFFPPFQEGKEGVAVVKVYGPIETAGGIFGITTGGADQVVRKIKRFRKNRLVKAIVMRVNSPGGTVAASQEILAEIKKAKKDGKKVVVSMADLAASGAYYISCHADKIFADPGTITGSIGVYVGGVNLTELARKIGIEVNVIKSGKFKDILSPWREMTEEERQLLQETVSEVYEQFLEEVSEGRGIPKEELMQIADGRIFTGSQAQKVRLVDEIGSFEDAVTTAAALAGLKGEPVIIKDYEGLWEDMFESIDYAAKKKTGLAELLHPGSGVLKNLPVTYLYTPPGGAF